MQQQQFTTIGLFEERSWRSKKVERLWRNTPASYFGVRLLWVLETRIRILNLLRGESGSQCNCSNMKVEMWEWCCRRAVNLAVAFRTDSIAKRQTFRKPKRRELQ